MATTQESATGVRADSVVATAAFAGEDRAHARVGDELEASALSLADAAHVVATVSEDREPERSLHVVKQSLSDLDSAFAGVRDRRATVDYATDDVTRLLSAIRSLHAAAAALCKLAD
ncbi:MAG: hypothetical protein ACR2L9_11065 [Solirubrobacteraceae bacterium]